MEMKRWAFAGVTPQQFLRAATLENAKMFGLDADIGTVEMGKIADLLLLSSSPLDSIDAYDDIEIVISNGKLIERSALSANESEHYTNIGGRRQSFD